MMIIIGNKTSSEAEDEKKVDLFRRNGIRHFENATFFLKEKMNSLTLKLFAKSWVSSYRQRLALYLSLSLFSLSLSWYLLVLISAAAATTDAQNLTVIPSTFISTTELQLEYPQTQTLLFSYSFSPFSPNQQKKMSPGKKRIIIV